MLLLMKKINFLTMMYIYNFIFVIVLEKIEYLCKNEYIEVIVINVNLYKNIRLVPKIFIIIVISINK